jgi:hypothetical protein
LLAAAASGEPSKDTAPDESSKGTASDPPIPPAPEGPRPGWTFEFEILGPDRIVLRTAKPSVLAATEDEAMTAAVAQLTLAEGESYRYTGSFTRHDPH